MGLSQLLFFSLLSSIGGAFWDGQRRVSRIPARSYSLDRCTSPVSSDSLSPLYCGPEKERKLTFADFNKVYVESVAAKKDIVKTFLPPWQEFSPLWTWWTGQRPRQPRDHVLTSPFAIRREPGDTIAIQQSGELLNIRLFWTQNLIIFKVSNSPPWACTRPRWTPWWSRHRTWPGPPPSPPSQLQSAASSCTSSSGHCPAEMEKMSRFE